MNDEDIEEILSYDYWPSVTINELGYFTATIYKYSKRTKKWKQFRNRTFPAGKAEEAWDYLRETLSDTLKFIR